MTASYLDRNPSAARVWRAHQWMCAAANAEQIAAAVNVASKVVLEAKNNQWMAAEFEKHNRARVIVGMPAASLEEFEYLLWALHIHLELLNSFANGTGH
jgi:predicted Kef-type K+ transport protein